MVFTLHNQLHVSFGYLRLDLRLKRKTRLFKLSRIFSQHVAKFNNDKYRWKCYLPLKQPSIWTNHRNIPFIGHSLLYTMFNSTCCINCSPLCWMGELQHYYRRYNSVNLCFCLWCWRIFLSFPKKAVSRVFDCQFDVTECSMGELNID